MLYPLTLPVTAGPTCIAIIIAIGAHGIQSGFEQKIFITLGYSFGILLMGVTVFLCYRYSYFIFNKFNKATKQTLMSLIAFINICIGLQIIWRGLSALILSIK